MLATLRDNIYLYLCMSREQITSRVVLLAKPDVIM